MRREFLLDTTPLTAYLFSRPAAIALLAPLILRRAAATHLLVYAEVHEYLRSRPEYDRREQELRELLGEVHPYTLTFPILRRYGDLRRQLRAPGGGGVIGDIDTLLAATAIERDLTLITCDTDFTRVPGLAVQIIDRSRFRA